MNWNKIKNDYPAAWEALEDYVGSSVDVQDFGDLEGVAVLVDDGELFETRDLYDFFDSKSLYCSIAYDHNTGGWLWDIVNRGNQVLWTESGDERTLCESAAFERAFSILNNQLLGE